MQTELLRYTICFCRCVDRILMLYRSNAPNRHRWNGLGGKIHAGETPLACIRREMLEEAEIDLSMAHHLYYAGIVTWNVGSDLLSPTGACMRLSQTCRLIGLYGRVNVKRQKVHCAGNQ